MIYFFMKEQQFFQCEIYPGRPHVLRVIAARGSELTEQFDSTAVLEERWRELKADLRRSGWRGPVGRDGRV